MEPTASFLCMLKFVLEKFCDSLPCIRLARRKFELTNQDSAGGKKSSVMMSRGAYHLAKKSGNLGLKSNSKVIFRKFRSEIVEYLQRYSSFSVRNGTTGISLPFAKLCSFQSLISRKQLRKIEVQMVSAISFGWFADFGKTLTIIQRSSQPVYSDKW